MEWGTRGVGDVWSGGRVEWVMCGVGDVEWVTWSG